MSISPLVWLHLEIFLAAGAGLFAIEMIFRSVVRLVNRPWKDGSMNRPHGQTRIPCTAFPGRTRIPPTFSLGQFPRSALCCLLMVVPRLLPAGELGTSFQNGGVTSTATELTDRVDLNFETSWEIALEGYGQSCPVIWKDVVYVTSVSGDNKEVYHIAAYRLENGKKLWQHDLKNASPQESTQYVSKAAPTPAVDRSGVCAFFEGGNLIKLGHDGSVIWEKNLVELYGSIESRHGLGASIEQDESSIFVWVERSDDPYLLAIDKQTGSIRWKSPGAGATSWASPRLVPISDSETHLVLSAIGSLTGVDPATGKQLWKFEGISGNSTPTPVPLGKGKFLIGATTGREADSGQRAAESNGVIQIVREDAGWKADYLWHAKEATSSFGSPIAHGGRAYFVNKTGVLFCLNVETGSELFRERIGGSMWATPFGSGKHLFFFQKDGMLQVYSADDKPHKLAEYPIFTQAENASSDPFAGKTLYGAIPYQSGFLVRSGSELIRLRMNPKENEN